MKINIKDFPEHGLHLIGPSDATFDSRLSRELHGKPPKVVEALTPFSVFLDNSSDRRVVACLIEWTLTTTEGRNEYYRDGVFDPRALMDAPDLRSEYRRQSGHIDPHSAAFYSLLSPEGVGPLRLPLTPEEAELFKAGKLDPSLLLQKSRAHLEKYSEITATIDAIIFDDGAFVGTNSSGFFERASAAIDANRDLLKEIESAQGDRLDVTFDHITEAATQPIDILDSNSTPSDYYHYFKKLYASDILQSSARVGHTKALETALAARRKAWPKLHKK